MFSMRLLSALFLFVCHLSYAKDYLIYSAHSEYAPISWEQNNSLVGVGPEIVERIFSGFGVEAKPKPYPWPRIFELARQQRVDVIAGLYFTAQRNEFLAYSEIHFSESRTVIVTTKGRDFEFESWDDLVGFTGGTTLGESWGEEFDNYMESHLDVEKVYSFKQNLLKLESGRIDYIIDNENYVKIVIKQLELSDRITILPTAVNTEKEYFAFSRSSSFIEHLPLFNMKLREMIDNGEISKLKEKYIEKSVSSTFFENE